MSIRINVFAASILITACGDSGGSAGSTEVTDATTIETTTETTSTSGETTTETPTGTTTGTPTTTEATTATTTTGETTETTGEEVDVLELLLAIEGLSVQELSSPVAGHRFFVLRYEQPVDHDDPDGPVFEQRMNLLHRDVAAPTVIVTSGYNITPTSAQLGEPAKMVAANQLTVEHRFFAESRPGEPDWTKLDIRQAATDHHRITTALQSVYPGRWLATGASKGGMAALFFRRFFPADVDGTIAYVAPYSQAEADVRYEAFIATRGDEACRQALRDFQREVLLRRPAMLARMAEDMSVAYELFGADVALETAALDLPFAFWQYEDASKCPAIPKAAASDDEVWEFLADVSPPNTDEDILRVEPWYWQSATELGGGWSDESGVADLLLFPGFNIARNFIVPGPGKQPPPYDPAAGQDVAEWLATEGESIMLIYGEDDPWTAGAFELGDAQDSYLFVAPVDNHGSLIFDLGLVDRAKATMVVETWAGTRARSEGMVREAPIRDTLRRFGW
ncbi:S28 family serine protease [Nannocystis radixulma]|uniref:S28 family serine protease n=1 Tax=Nannocystis radixulma TaxID=2995305 RepID=A0ABT5BLS4_9BACT|nr:S28 family serine protease [Nannocystis radixulma]MDC0675042.1 S28 family serine protease [Nannocystis radixulma]